MMIFQDRKSASGTRQYVSKQERIEGKDAHSFRFFGKIANRLGIAGIADRLIFNHLAGNRMPDGKEKLTPRDGKNRVICKDANFNFPKSVTLVANFSPAGEQVKQAVVESIIEAVTAIAEPLAEVRFHIPGKVITFTDGEQYREPGKTINLRTGEILVGLDIHESNRAGDPHFHGHAYIMNVTALRGERYALKTTSIHKAAKKLETDCLNRVRGKVERLGFRTRDKGKFWEIDGISDATIRKFSTRRAAIETLYAGAKHVSDRLRQKAGLLTRAEKPNIIELDVLKKEWRERLTPKELGVIRSLQSKPKIGRGLSKSKLRVAQLRQLGNHISKGRSHEIKQPLER